MQYFSVFGQQSAGVGRAWDVVGDEAAGIARCNMKALEDRLESLDIMTQ